MQTQTQQTHRKKTPPQKRLRTKKTDTPLEGEVLPKVSRNLEKILRWYEHPNSRNLKDIHLYYTKDVFFKDPLTEVYSAEELEHYYAKMFERLKDVRFVIKNKFEESHQAFVTWVMTATTMGRGISIKGSTHLKFDGNGLCEYHRDYFDLAEEVYEQIPVLGFIFKGFKKLLT